MSMVDQQNVSGALHQFQQAHKVAPSSPAVNFNLSLVYEAEDQLLSAKEHAQNYLQLAPGAVDASEVQMRITNIEDELRKNPREKGKPGDCHDLYRWALLEQRKTKKSKNALQRQAVMEIMISSQKGDCENAYNPEVGYREIYMQ